MRRVINRLIYDTEKAECVAGWTNGLGGSDFRNNSEAVYLTNGGRWFLHGEGGAMTRWSRPSGDGRCGGEGIQPMESTEALAWLEAHGETDAIEEHFADSIEEA